MTRDEHGRFVKGETGNPLGRSPREREERYYKIMMNSVTFEDWKRIIAKAVKQASNGDAQARKWLSDYLIGTVPQKLDITSKGESIKQDNGQLDRAISTLANALRESLLGTADKQAGDMDASKQASMVGVPK